MLGFFVLVEVEFVVVFELFEGFLFFGLLLGYLGVLDDDGLDWGWVYRDLLLTLGSLLLLLLLLTSWLLLFLLFFLLLLMMFLSFRMLSVMVVVVVFLQLSFSLLILPEPFFL